MIPHRPDPRPRQEPVRIGLTVVWVATLAFWSYHQVLFLHCYPYADQNTLESASRILRVVSPLWLACFLPALALGLAGYALMHRPLRHRFSCPVRCGQERLRTAQTYMTFCVAICLFLVNWRLLYYEAPADNGWGRISLPLTAFHWGAAERWWGPGLLELHDFIAALGLGVVFLRVWELVRPWPGHRRNLIALSLSLLAAGLLVPWSDALYTMPSSIPPGLGDLDQDDPVHRGLVLGERDFERDGRLALSRYFATYDGEGRLVPWWNVQENVLPGWDIDAAKQDPWEPCEICQLPGVGVWTTRGLSLALSEGWEPDDAAPSWVIEVPRGQAAVRLYDPDGSGPITTMPAGALWSVVPDADWVVLKVDFEVPLGSVLFLLEELRDQDVRRVDLAVIPHGYQPLPAKPPHLTINSGAGGEVYRPSPPEGRRKRHIPPPPRRGTQCPFVYDFWETWSEWAPDPPDSLPESVSIIVSEEMRYGEFVAVLQGAIAGGAGQIDLAAEKERHPTDSYP